ncbi:hypothetical protein [Acetobacter aceti]|uniref:Uncharacterized protein n=1 Tax=Acetobacter aceti TaxID=435 RepID=A0A6S6PLS7_ACEAC|nr:hypothetical protein [Acetobacter aceti]BCI68283.1 hypothetical protein AAJCM20276_29070 [Acetobacter aceti]
MSYYNLLRGAELIPNRNEDSPPCPSEVLCHESFYNDVYNNLSQEQYDGLSEIIDCFEEGRPIPAIYRRNNQNRNHNHILFNAGVRHLHLERERNDDVLYYLVYDTSEMLGKKSELVVLLTIGEHARYMTEDHEGENLLSEYKDTIRPIIEHYSYIVDKNKEDIRAKRFFSGLLNKFCEEGTSIPEQIEDLNDIGRYSPQREIPASLKNG